MVCNGLCARMTKKQNRMAALKIVGGVEGIVKMISGSSDVMISLAFCGVLAGGGFSCDVRVSGSSAGKKLAF